MAEFAGEFKVLGAAQCRNRVVAGAAISAALVIGGCGSTAPSSPSAPSPVRAPAAQYPSIVGEWGGGAGLLIQYHGPDASSSSHCDGSLSVRAQTEGTFSGLGGLTGSSLTSDKQCPGSFAFSAEMMPDGTITSFRPDRPFGTSECMPVSEVSFSSGTAGSAGFRIEVTDHAMCRWPPLDARNPFIRDTDRTFTMSITQRRASSPQGSIVTGRDADAWSLAVHR
jgi:hypothetical protein